LGEAAAKMLEVIKPVAAEATNTMKDLQQTAPKSHRITDENSELNLALTQFKTFGEHLSDLTRPTARFRIRSPTSKKSAQASRRTTTSR